MPVAGAFTPLELQAMRTVNIEEDGEEDLRDEEEEEEEEGNAD